MSKIGQKGWSEAVNRRTARQYNVQNRTKRQIMIYNTLPRKLKMEQHKPGVNSCAPKRYAVPAPHVVPSCCSCYKPSISHAWRKIRIVITRNGTYPWSFVTQIFSKCTLCKYFCLIDINIKLGVNILLHFSTPYQLAHPLELFWRQ